MVAFYNRGDQAIYDSGQYFIPQEKYRLNYNAPVIEEEQENSIGIPNTNSFINFTNSNDRNFNNNFNTGNFQSILDARQKKLNNPSDIFLGFNTMRDQQLTGPDMGEYIGSGTAIPQETTMMGNVQGFFTPQSADQIISEGYEDPRFQPGIIGMLAGKIDNYRNLPRGDQAFIARNMGYTGPTVFGENNSGLSKDIFGKNTRSLRNNYGEFVGNEVTNLESALKNARSKYDTEEEYLDMTKLMRTKLNFYRNKVKERDADRKAAAEKISKDAQIDMQSKAFRDAKARQLTGNKNTPTGGSDGQSGGNYRGGAGFASANTYGGSGTRDDMGADSFAAGGRAGYFYGGRVNFKNGGLASIL